MPEPAAKLEGCDGCPCRLLGEAGDPQGYRAVSVRTHTGVVTSVLVGMRMMSVRVVKVDAALCIGERRGDEPRYVRSGPTGVAGLENEVLVCNLLCNIDELFGQNKRLPGSTRRGSCTSFHTALKSCLSTPAGADGRVACRTVGLRAVG
jgi:hypothetical protein